MKFTCEKNALVSAVSVASRTVAQKSTIPALEGIYIRAGVKLTLSGYNLETGITISVDAGRIRHHLKHNLWKWENIILFAGYQAEGTLGRSLLNGAKTVRLFGEEISVSAEICALHGTSGHADRDGLLKWVQAIKRKPRVVFVNHGDEENCEAFRDRLVSEGYSAVAPFSGTEFDLLQGLFLMVTEGQRIEKKGHARKKEVFAQLVEAAQRLVAVAMACREQSNQRLRRFTSEIELLIDTWKD